MCPKMASMAHAIVAVILVLSFSVLFAGTVLTLTKEKQNARCNI